MIKLAIKCNTMLLVTAACRRLSSSVLFFKTQSTVQPFVIVWGVDSNLPNISGRAWCKRLNPSTTYRRFSRWLDRKNAALA
jgi:hypothetical protein